MSFTTINCTQVCNKMLKFTTSEAHTQNTHGATGSGEECRQTWRRGVDPPLQEWTAVPAELLWRLRRLPLLTPGWAQVLWGSTYKRPGTPVISKWAVCLSRKLILAAKRWPLLFSHTLEQHREPSITPHQVPLVTLEALPRSREKWMTFREEVEFCDTYSRLRSAAVVAAVSR